MRRIEKGAPPPELTHWLRKNPHGRYDDMEDGSRRAIRCAAIVEQHGLCAYCCARIDVDSSHNEHVIPQSRDPNRTVDFSNLVASCKTDRQCGKAKKNQVLPLTPWDPRCETDLIFSLSGAVKGANIPATETIRILNLDNRALREKRKRMIDCLIYQEGNLQLLDDNLLKILLDEMQPIDPDGCLQPYAPVLVHILRHYLSA